MRRWRDLSLWDLYHRAIHYLEGEAGAVGLWRTAYPVDLHRDYWALVVGWVAGRAVRR